MSSMTIAGNCGSLLLGGLAAFVLSGCVNMQYAMYWITYPKDTRQIRAIVTLTWILDISHSIFVATSLWQSIIGLNGDFSFEQLNKIPWSITIASEVAVLMTFLTQSFFARRIYTLHKKWIIAGPIAILAFCRLVTASVTASQFIRLGHYSDLAHPFLNGIITFGIALSAFVDILITTCLCYSFREMRKTRHSATSHRILDTLTRWTLQNGLITCAGATASLICFKSMPHTLSYLGLHFVMGKLYANSLLAAINARESYGKLLGNTSGASNQAVILLRNFGMEPSGISVVNPASSPKIYPIEVRIECSIVSATDIQLECAELSLAR